MRKRFEVLDAFRGVAALMVAIYHLHVVGYLTDSVIIYNSYLFVEFFFVLSGFVISYSFTSKINEPFDVVSFIKKRFSRIYPLHLFMTLAFVPFSLANLFMGVDLGDRFSIESLLSNVVLIQALGVNDGPSWNLPSWSISVEFYTYVVFALLMLATDKLLPRLRFLYIPLIVSCISAVVLCFNSTMGDASNWAFFRCMYSFFLGVASFYLSNRIKASPLLEWVSIIVLIAFLSSQKIEDQSLMAFLSPFVFFSTVIAFSKESSAISCILKHRNFQLLGMLSFSIYLTHAWFVSGIKAISKVTEKVIDYQFMFIVDGKRTIDFGFGIINDVIYIPYLIVVLLISSITYRYIEKPWQNRINQFSFTKSHNHKINS